MQRLQRLVGLGKAKQLVLTGDRITAPQAHQIGLVDELAPAGEAIDAALDLARRIAAKPPLSVQAGKKALNLGRDIPLEQAQAIDLRFCGEIAGTQDRAESLAAFLEKRQPRLVGN
jgi:enoyl-CoA hydratase/carnithine racemase